MNEKQTRLIDFFRRLPEPVPPPRQAPGASFGLEAAEPPSPPPVAPPGPSPDSVRAMLEKRRAVEIAASTSVEYARGISEAVSEEATAAQPPGTPTVPAGTTRLLRRPQPVELPVTDRIIELATSAADKALNDQELTLEEQDVLEAIVLPGKRPVLDIVNGDISPPPPGWEFLTEFRPLIQNVLPAIGRIDVPPLIAVSYAGTGFFVGDGLLLTNRHVAEFFVQGVGTGPGFLRFRADLGPRFDPQYEVGDPDPGSGEDRYDVVEALLVHPHWDAALLRVRPVPPATLPSPLKLARRPPLHFGAGATPQVMVIGYPDIDPRSSVPEQMNIFRQIFERKRLMPGYLTGFSEYTSKLFKSTVEAATHDASTLGGNSGSAVIDASTGLVMALHFAGHYLVANYGVPTWELALDSHITDFGVAFEDPVNAAPAGPGITTPPWLKAWDSIQPRADA